ncbi:MAG: sterol desaturase family protein [Pseudomonadota bacterium]|nr:sterol desaturase family protein [Pseudomonadota bacterium]
MTDPLFAEPGALAFLVDVAILLALIYPANLIAYFGMGFALLRINDSHPERRIQKRRDGLKRAIPEMKESCVSILVTTALLSLALTLQGHGMTLWTPWTGVWGVLAGTALMVVGYDTYYYFAHRALHTRALYRFHQWHHRSVAPTAWSSDSQSVGETFLIQSFQVVAVVLLPVPAWALILHRIYDHVNGQLGHVGHEYFADRTTRFPSPMVCTTYHDLHHEKFRWNFGNYFSFWDRVMGTLEPDYDARVAALDPSKDARPAE